MSDCWTTHDLELPAHALGVALVHREQVAGEEAGLVAAGGAADLDDDVLRRRWGPWGEHQAELDPRRRGGVGLAAPWPWPPAPPPSRVGFDSRQLPGVGRRRLPPPGRLEGRRRPASARGGAGRPRCSGCGRRAPRGRPGPPASAPAPGGPPGGGRGAGRPSGVLGFEGPGHDGAATLHPDRSAGSSEASRLVTATSIWSSSGSRVVRACSHRPGTPGSAASAGRRRP